MEPAEVEFLAENELITIIPKFSESRISLIAGEFGPFNPGLPTRVPLWLAISLKQKQRCRIQSPEWLKVEALSEKKQEEKDSPVFLKMPSEHYMEVANLLLSHASDDIPHSDEIRALVKDIWDLRVAKLRKGINEMVAQQESHALVNNLTLMELNTARSFLTEALNHLSYLQYHAAQHTVSGGLSRTS
jgi:GINS complex subunit 2